jgi:hypothetical protein
MHALTKQPLLKQKATSHNAPYVKAYNPKVN